MDPQQPPGDAAPPAAPPAGAPAPPPAMPAATPPPPPLSTAPPTMAPPGPAPTEPWQAPIEEVGPAPGVRFASPVSRLIAYVVDYFVIGVVLTALSLVLLTILGIALASASDTVAALTGIVFVALFFVVSIGYFPYFWAKDGQTPGMKLLKIRVVRDADGGPINGTTAVLRLIGYWVSGAVFYLGYVWILVDKRRRGWHDLLAGTVVIEQPGA